MRPKELEIDGSQVVMHTDGIVCQSGRELASSPLFSKVVRLYIQRLAGHSSPLLEELQVNHNDEDDLSLLVSILQSLTYLPKEHVVKIIRDSKRMLSSPHALHMFVEGLYDFWRGFDRYLVCHSRAGETGHDIRPYRTFNNTIETLTHVVRAVYRDICENITGDHPRIYRQVSAAFDVGVIATQAEWPIPAGYPETLRAIPIIRQVMINPPLIIDPPMNKRTGEFSEVPDNPVTGLNLDPHEWLCYPAQVGPIVIFIYFHQCFIGLGCALANLFELATDEQIQARPEAIYMYGVAPAGTRAGDGLPTIFFDDTENGLMVASVPGEPRFGYFGYLKKMTLTLHNIVMMKRGLMPFHGAMTRVVLKEGVSANILIVGDTGTGKSETLEALRALGRDRIRELIVIADDMGSLAISETGRIVGYGTETGAFIRLDDLQRGYAYAQIDRAILMSPQKTNARVVLPVTTLDEVLKGYPVDILLYANNYEQVDSGRPIVELFRTPEEALAVFGEGAAMSKGTTTSTGIVKNYFANIFGPCQRRELHEKLAKRTFQAAYDSGMIVGQMRTRLGLSGYGIKGPAEASAALLDLISDRGRSGLRVR